MSEIQNLDQCIIDAVNGDEEALKLLYQNYSSVMFKFALSIVKKYELAEDVIQDVFVNLIQYGKGQKIKQPKGWLFTIIRNQSLKILREEHSNKCISLEDCDTVFAADDIMQYLDDSPENLEAMKCLNEIELQIIILCIYGGFTQMQTSKILGLSFMKVRSKYNYAVKKLKKFYIDGSDSYD